MEEISFSVVSAAHVHLVPSKNPRCALTHSIVVSMVNCRLVS